MKDRFEGEGSTMKKENVVRLSQEERTTLETIVKHGENKVRVIRRAQMLLWSDEGHSDLEIAELLSTTALTVSRTRTRWVNEQRLADKPKPGRKRRLDGKQEAFLVALACSDAPQGRDEWTLQLLADKLVALGVVEQPVSDDTIGRILKKTSLNPGSSANGVFRKLGRISSGAWRMCWTCMQNLISRGSPWSASMNVRVNCAPMSERVCR